MSTKLSTIEMASLVCSKINKGDHFICKQYYFGPSCFELEILAINRSSPIFFSIFLEDLSFFNCKVGIFAGQPFVNVFNAMLKLT